MKLSIPELSLIVLIGPSGSGKSTFAREHFKPTETLSSDYFRSLVADDENDQSATIDAFDALHYIASKRLAIGKMTVVDATNVQTEARKPLVALARQYHCIPVAIVFNLPDKVCMERNNQRTGRNLPSRVIQQQSQQMHRALHGLEREGFRHVFVLSSSQEIEEVTIERVQLYNNKRNEHGPFDIIGDIHGCYDELENLLIDLGYTISKEELTNITRYRVIPPQGRKVIFLGDLVDRGPKINTVLKLVMDMVDSKAAYCVPGNHDIRLLRKLRGKNIAITHGLAESLEQLQKEPVDFKEKVIQFLDGLVSHYVLDEGSLVVAHAGMKQEMQGRGSGKVRDFALYGETTGETDEFGLPIRYNWASEYRGKSMVIYGHTPVPKPDWLNQTLNIDTGCVFGGKLTAFRYPEKELISVSAKQIYCPPVKPFLTEGEENSTLSAQQQYDEIIDIEEVLGKNIIQTRLHHNVTIREENAIAALEVMSRFAANPKWLIYLPPTISPSETTKEPGLLEHPAEAFQYYKNAGVQKVVCEEKHMGSRAVVIVCKTEEGALKRFGVKDEGLGICYTRTGRRFFNDANLESEFLNRICQALGKIGFWEEFETGWVCLDCELMPWSVKAQELIREQYAAVGTASRIALNEVIAVLEKPSNTSSEEIKGLLEHTKNRLGMAESFVRAYQHYCWPVKSISDLKLAPFHLMATEGKLHIDKNHLWHMETLRKIRDGDKDLLFATNYKMVELDNPESVSMGIQWWEEFTNSGGEGMVVKPFDFISQGRKGLIQPAVKCRGPEYLRIIYGPEYTAPENLERLRERALSAKRSLALREFALGVEALERFIRHEPLYEVHKCVFGILALESEPVDPRL